jgi:hypothetical protein
MDHHFSYIKFLKKPKDLWTYLSAMLTRSRDNNQLGDGVLKVGGNSSDLHTQRWGLLFLTTKQTTCKVLCKSFTTVHETLNKLQLVQERVEKPIFPSGVG